MTKKRRNIPASKEKQPRRLIFCCSGASNVGVVSYLAAIRLAQGGFGNFSCIAGIGGNNLPMIRAAKNAQERIIIDGCPIGCARRIMDSNLIPVDRYVIITELGIKKTHDFDVGDRDVDTVTREVRRPLEKAPPVNLLVGRSLREGDDCSS
jgi:uncharacterized metal-binding protein